MADINTKQRRDYGSGSIVLRKDGRWMARLRIGIFDGKEKIKTFYGASQAEVKKKLNDFKRELHKNDYVVVQKNTVETYMTNWLVSVKQNTLKPKSYDRLETTLKNQIFPYIGHLQIASLTSDNIQDLINKLRDENKSYSTIKKTYDAINDCFRTGVIKKSVITNPALGVTLPANIKKNTSEIKYYQKEEIEKLVDSALKKYKNGQPIFRLGYIVPFGLNTGLRISEILGLKWENVDLEKHLITITDTIVTVRNRDKNATTKYKLQDQKSTKSQSGQRTVSLNKKAYEALLYMKSLNNNSEYVFASKNRKPVSPRNIDRLIRNACERAGFKKERILGAHALRHTFASMLFAKGVDVKTVSEILGHSSVKITYDTYIHLIDEQKKKAIQLIEDF